MNDNSPIAAKLVAAVAVCFIFGALIFALWG